MRAYRISVSEQDEDLVVARLWEAGTAGIEVEAAPAPGRSSLLAYFEGEISPARLAEGVADVAIESAPVPKVDWVARFRESFRSFRVGAFVIGPPWDRPDEAAGVPLLVDPGRAFGTGTHETTRLCLAALEERAKGARLGHVLDVGAGTGLLGLAAARLGARSVTAVDVDPEAILSARAHARLNGLRLHLLRADGAAALRAGVFDLVLANLTAPLLKLHAPDLESLPAPGGALVLSGLLETDLDEVQAAFSRWSPPRVRHDGEWAALVYEAPR